MLNKKNGKEKGNSVNTGNIKEDIEILKNIIEVYESCSVPEIDMQVDITFGKKEVNAIKTILGNLEALCDMQMAAGRELKNAKQINEEHQKINGELRKKVKELEEENKLILNSKVGVDLSYEDYIPKQKIKDKIEKLNRKEQELQNSISEEEREEYEDANISYLLCDIEIRREVLQELLQEEDK